LFAILLLLITAADTQRHPFTGILKAVLCAASVVNLVEVLWFDEQMVAI
jgi:hypothetical protein